MAWAKKTTPTGEIYYYNSATNETSWELPAELHGSQSTVSDGSEKAPKTQEEIVAESEAGKAVLDKINSMIDHSPFPARQCCLPFSQWLNAYQPYSPHFSLRPFNIDVPTVPGIARLLIGPIVYGVLFVPFVFAILQQTAMEGHAIDAFNMKERLSRRAWVAAFLFLTSVVLYVCLAFTALPDEFYEKGSLRLLMILSAVIVVVWIQQALTFQYISMRPELARLEKNRKKKYHLCGHAYSTLNPRKLANYIHLTVIVSEFAVLASVCFHESIPWREGGSREDDSALVDFMQTVLPQALVGLIRESGNVLLLAAIELTITVYLLIMGYCIFTQTPPSHYLMTVAADLFAGTLYTSINARLLQAAYSLDESSKLGRVVAMIFLFAFSTTAIFTAVMRGDPNEAESKKQNAPDVRFLPK